MKQDEKKENQKKISDTSERQDQTAEEKTHIPETSEMLNETREDNTNISKTSNNTTATTPAFATPTRTSSNTYYKKQCTQDLQTEMRRWKWTSAAHKQADPDTASKEKQNPSNRKPTKHPNNQHPHHDHEPVPLPPPETQGRTPVVLTTSVIPATLLQVRHFIPNIVVIPVTHKPNKRNIIKAHIPRSNVPSASSYSQPQTHWKYIVKKQTTASQVFNLWHRLCFP